MLSLRYGTTHSASQRSVIASELREEPRLLGAVVVAEVLVEDALGDRERDRPEARRRRRSSRLVSIDSPTIGSSSVSVGTSSVERTCVESGVERRRSGASVGRS